MKTYLMTVTETVTSKVKIRAKTLHEAKKYVSEMCGSKKVQITGTLIKGACNESD